MDDAVAVALVARAQLVLRLGMPAAAALRAPHPVGGEEAVLPLFLRPPIHQRHAGHAADSNARRGGGCPAF